MDTITVRKRRFGHHNDLKIRTLEIFRNFGFLNPPAWAALANFSPPRSSYTYLLRLHRLGLLHRTHDGSGLLLYGLSDRGRQRLAYLTNSRQYQMFPGQTGGD